MAADRTKQECFFVVGDLLENEIVLPIAIETEDGRQRIAPRQVAQQLIDRS